MRDLTKPLEMKRTRDPYMITVRYAAKCAETGKELKPGDQALYYPGAEKGKSLYHPESKQADDWRTWKADLAMGHNY